MLGAETDYLGSSCLRIFWFRVKQWISLKSFPLGAAYMRQWIRSAWFTEIMACHLSGAKPLSEPMLGYRELGSWEQNSTNFYSKYKTFHSRKCVWKYRLRNDVKRTFHQLYMNNSITMMTLSNRSISAFTGSLCGEFTGHLWIPLTKASDAELWYFLWSAPE